MDARNWFLRDGLDKIISRVKYLKYQSLGLRVSIEANVEILFGLGVWASGLLQVMKEVAMNSSFVNSCVWCGVAFLRGHGGTLPIQMRERHLWKNLSVPGETKRGSNPLPRTIFI